MLKPTFSGAPPAIRSEYAIGWPVIRCRVIAPKVNYCMNQNIASIPLTPSLARALTTSLAIPRW